MPKGEGGGRPSKYSPAHCDSLVEHMKSGLSFESFAGTVGVHRDTLYEWEKRHAKFSDAKKRGEALSLLWWERLGKAAMLGEPITDSNGRKLSFENFNTTMWIFSMKNRHGWRDRHEVKTDPGDKPKPNTSALAEALAAQIETAIREREKTLEAPAAPAPQATGLLADSV